MKLQTPYGSAYLLLEGRVEAIGNPRVSARFPKPTREVILMSGKSLYISDTEENMRALVGDAYVPDKPFKKPKKKKMVEVEVDDDDE